jgi:hypothetical protein
MRPRKPHELRSALEAKGFEPQESDHTWYFLHIRGRKTDIRTKVHHHPREYDDRLLGLVAKQMRLTTRELGDFLECPLTRDGYIERMRDRGHL